MKVLFLPENIASMPAITVEFLNRNKNIEAVCITTVLHKYQTATPEVIYLNRIFSKNYFINKIFQYIWRRTSFKKEIKKWIRWADVLHYVWSPAMKHGEDLKFAQKLNKPIFIEWVGSDIRNPNFLKSINPYYNKIFNSGYEYARYESTIKSEERQKIFSKYNAVPLLSPEMTIYADKKLFSEIKLLFQRLNVKDFTPRYPQLNNSRPLIVHSPTAKLAKGSNFIISIIDELKVLYDFEFIMLHDMPRAEVLGLIQKADIFIDQIIIGSYGMAAMEAMSYGKPVMCYIMPEVFEAGLPDECPIINSNPDNLKQKLIELFEDPHLRHEIGKKSRAFVEEFHDAEKISKYLIQIYSSALNDYKYKSVYIK